VIEAEQIVLQGEWTSNQIAIETVEGCIAFCECDLPMEAAEGEEKKEASMSPELKSRMEMIPVIMRMVRKSRPAVESPKRVL
jgi:hypothetical protein